MWRSTHVNVDITNNAGSGVAGVGGGGIQRSSSTHFQKQHQQQQQQHLHHAHQSHYNDGATTTTTTAQITPVGVTSKQLSQLQRDRFSSSQAILQDAIAESKISLHVNYRHSGVNGNAVGSHNNNNSNNNSSNSSSGSNKTDHHSGAISAQPRPRPVSMYEQYRSRPYGGASALDSPPPLTPAAAAAIALGRSESFYFGESAQSVAALRQQHQQLQFQHSNNNNKSSKSYQLQQQQQQQRYAKQMQSSPAINVGKAPAPALARRANLRQSPSELVCQQRLVVTNFISPLICTFLFFSSYFAFPIPIFFILFVGGSKKCRKSKTRVVSDTCLRRRQQQHIQIIATFAHAHCNVRVCQCASTSSLARFWRLHAPSFDHFKLWHVWKQKNRKRIKN